MYTIAVFSPGRNYAGLSARNLDFDQAAEQVTNLILGDIEGREPTAIERRMARTEGQAIAAYAPSSITLSDGTKVTVDR